MGIEEGLLPQLYDVDTGVFSSATARSRTPGRRLRAAAAAQCATVPPTCSSTSSARRPTQGPVPDWARAGHRPRTGSTSRAVPPVPDAAWLNRATTIPQCAKTAKLTSREQRRSTPAAASSGSGPGAKATSPRPGILQATPRSHHATADRQRRSRVAPPHAAGGRYARPARAASSSARAHVDSPTAPAADQTACAAPPPRRGLHRRLRASRTLCRQYRTAEAARTRTVLVRRLRPHRSLPIVVVTTVERAASRDCAPRRASSPPSGPSVRPSSTQGPANAKSAKTTHPAGLERRPRSCTRVGRA